MVWPAMLIYPESMQNDAIEAFHEHHALSDHLDAMFGERVLQQLNEEATGSAAVPTAMGERQQASSTCDACPPCHCNAGPEAPPLVWDTEQQYTRDRLDVYYMSHSGKPISEEQLTEVGLCSSGLRLQPATDHW